MKKLLIAGAVLALTSTANAACIYNQDTAYLNCTDDGRAAPGPDRGKVLEQTVGTDTKPFPFMPFRPPGTLLNPESNSAARPTR